MASLVQGAHRHGGATVGFIMQYDLPRLTADRTVLDIGLRGTAPRIERDVRLLCAIRALHRRADVGGAISERKVIVDHVIQSPSRVIPSEERNLQFGAGFARNLQLFNYRSFVASLLRMTTLR